MNEVNGFEGQWKKGSIEKDSIFRFVCFPTFLSEGFMCERLVRLVILDLDGMIDFGQIGWLRSS